MENEVSGGCEAPTANLIKIFLWAFDFVKARHIPLFARTKFLL
jgi:hypothetical protein